MKKNNYDNLPLTKLTLAGSNFNVNDIKILKVFNDRQDQLTKEYISDVYDKHAKLICDTVKGMLDEIKTDLKLVHAELKDIKADLGHLHAVDAENKRYIDELRTGFDNHERRIHDLEKQIEK